MLLDAATLTDDLRLDADLAIVGGGLAALTLAQELAARTPARIVILESGGMAPSAAGELLDRGSARLHDPFGGVRDLGDYLQQSRCRCLGGSAYLWGGKCAELDPGDFQARRWIEHSGWPFDYETLKPYLNRACAVLELPAFQRHAPLDETQPRSPLLINRERTLTTGLRRHSAVAERAPGGRFAAFCKRAISAPSVTAYLHATVTELVTAAPGGSVAALTARTAAGRRLHVRAGTYVLAAGGLENARLMMLMPHGNTHGLVGRYFLGHAVFRRTHGAASANELVPWVDPARLALYLDKDPRQLQGVLQLSRNAQLRERLPSCSLTLEPAAAPGDPLQVFFMLEQRPHPDSRLELGAERDPLGLPRLRLEWRFQPQDLLDLERAAALFAAELSAHRIGELKYRIEPRALLEHVETVRHHMGTTRMHVEPAHGVVDQHCRAHGFDNLYVAGTSVFPTGGVGNPTLTLLALTLRLADHLREQVFTHALARPG